MGSSSKKEKQKKKEALFDNLQLLRAVTNSSATNKESIIVDATKYIEELKEKVERLSHEESYYCCTSTAETACTTTPTNTNTTTAASSSSTLNSLPMVKVETLEKGGFLINVVSENSCPGLLVWILEAFHELGLDVLDARVSCSDTFQFQAVGGGDNQEIGRGESMDIEMVKEAVQQAINNWNASTDASTTNPYHHGQNDDT